MVGGAGQPRQDVHCRLRVAADHQVSQDHLPGLTKLQGFSGMHVWSAKRTASYQQPLVVVTSAGPRPEHPMIVSPCCIEGPAV